MREIYQNANISVVAKPESFSWAVAISKMDKEIASTG
jgi:hypothetical protein